MGFRFANLIVEQGGGDVDTVEDVANVVQDAGGHFGHARPPGSQHEALLRLGQLGVDPFLGGDLILKFLRSLGDADFEWSLAVRNSCCA